jgi:RNAse (barnase) inhibitor barstar
VTAVDITLTHIIEALLNSKNILMDNKILFSLDKPAAYVIINDDNNFCNFYLRLTIDFPDSIIRMIRGKKSKTINDFNNEIAAALQFPYYFGENSAALNDCITDMEWLKGNAYLLMFQNAEDFLCNVSDEQFHNLVELLIATREEWLTPNKYIPRERQPTPFHLLFQCDNENSVFIQRMMRSGLDFKILDNNNN